MIRVRSLLSVIGLLTGALCLFLANVACALTITPGNYLVANGGTITEYTPAGGVAQQIVVASPTAAPGVIVRDLVVDQMDRIHVLTWPGQNMASPQMYLSTFDLLSETWTHNTKSGWSQPSVGYYGGIGINDQYIYAPDQFVFGYPNKGILRLPLNDLAAPVRFQEPPFGDKKWHEVTVGLDGFVYALATGPGPGMFARFDPDTLNFLNQLSLYQGAAVMGVAVAANGDIYSVDLNNNLHHFNSVGALIETVAVTGNTDLELSPDGTLLIGSAGDTLTVLHISDLNSQTVIDTSAQRRLGPLDRNFVTFIAAVPEPAAWQLILSAAVLGLVLVAVRSRRSRRVGSDLRSV